MKKDRQSVLRLPIPESLRKKHKDLAELNHPANPLCVYVCFGSNLFD